MTASLREGRGLVQSPGGASSLSVQALQGQLRAMSDIGATLARAVGLEALLREIVPQVSTLMRAERATLFYYDPHTVEIWSKVIDGDNTHEIRLKAGVGIAGWAAQHRETVVVTDAYEDPRFNSEVDKRTGFRTRSVAAVPILNREGNLLGVLQVLNHVDGGAFSAEEVRLLEAIAAQAAYAVENARLAERLLEQNRELEAAKNRAERRQAELDLIFQLEQETASTESIEELLDSMIVRACERLRSSAGAVFLLDKDNGRLFFRRVAGPQQGDLLRSTVPTNDGVLGWVSAQGEPLIVNRPQDDPRFGTATQQALDFPVQSLLAVPLVWDSKLLGAVEVLDPKARASGTVGYDIEDLKVLTVIAGQVARAVTVTLQRKAQQAEDRMAVIGRMLAGVAHDLRNPMTVISGYSQLMVGEDSEPERQKQSDRVLQQIDEMTGMIADLLAYARGDSRLRPVAVNVSTLADEIANAVGLHCKPRGVELSVTGSPGTVAVDLGRVKRIVYNLARNAIDVLSGGDSLTIALEARNGGLMLQVSDTGPGLPEGMHHQLFEAFTSIGKVDGTGLGLSIVRRFVDDHKGDIKVDSKPGEGTTFTIVLPGIRENSERTQ